MRSQVTLRTAFTVCFAVVATAALVLFVLQTRLALTLTVAAMMVAIALDHVVRRMEARGIRRGWAIALTTLAVVLLLIGLMLIVVPTAAHQLRDFIASMPRILGDLRQSPRFQSLNARFEIEERLKEALSGAFGIAQTAVNPILTAVTGALSAIAGFVTVLALTVFMLVFGGGLVRRLLALVPAHDRPRWEGVLAKSYQAVGGYLGGVLLICSVNATLTTTVLALIGTPYFLPLGLLSGFSSLVPYAGPILTGGFITLVTLITGGAVKGLITLGYFLLYGQLEGNVLGPFVFRRTVHLDPLVTLLGILFLAELLGIAGAVVAVPAVALAQILVRELLAARRERLAAEAVLGHPAAPPETRPPVEERTPVPPRSPALGKPR
ncbi:MAG TPA: AI-2E family transporter [Myxococcaceae bacterium]|nr:AI-2E family transporter [Myxococcaceae bacterium]